MRSLGEGVMSATLSMSRKSDLTSELRRFTISKREFALRLNRFTLSLSQLE